jgi:HlyD family secretion protein
MKKWMKTSLTILIILLVVAGIIFGAPLVVERITQRQMERSAAAILENTVFARIDTLTSTVSATGTVRAEQSALIFWQTSGIVDQVLVDTGDTVSDGELLAELDGTSLSQAIINAQIEQVNAQKALDDLLSSNSPAAAAQLELVRAQQAYDEAVEDRGSKNYQRVSDLTLDQLYADWLLAQNEVEDAEEFYSNYEDRPEDDPVRLSVFSRLTTARKNEQRARANYYYALGGPDELEIDEADAVVAVAQARLEDAQREWERLKEGPAAEDILTAQTRLEAAEATLKLAYLESTFAGTVTDVNSKPGDFVSAGSQAFRIDNLDHLYVDAYVLEIDINSVYIGQPVAVVFDAIPGVAYQGVVNTVSSIGERITNQVQFKVTIEILDADAAVKPGMTAEITITTGAVENALLVPNQALVFNEDGTVHVNVVNALGGVRDVTIEIGKTANSYTEVLSGDVKDGDELLLNLPDVTDGVREMMMQSPAGQRGFFGDD